MASELISPFTLLASLVITLIISLIAMRMRALSKGGVLAAIALGMGVYSFSNWAWFLVMIVFFFSSSFLTRFKAQEKKKIGTVIVKGGPRDGWQVLANGALPALFAVFFYFTGMPILYIGFAGAVAAVNADTWSTEIGVLSKEKPRSVLSGKKLAAGTSGGITILGTIASAVGAFLIAASAAGFLTFQTLPDATLLTVLISVLVGGFVGGLADSFTGAAIQSVYYCSKCRKMTEQWPTHKCGTKTHLRQGIKWIDNDVTNLASSLAGALAAMLVYALF